MRESTRVNIKAYDTGIDTYKERTDALDDEQIGHRTKFLSLLPGSSEILDVGCGTGRDAAYFTAQGHEVTGIDLSEKMLGLARSRVPDATFRKMDFAEISLDRRFDGVWMEAALFQAEKEIVPDILAAIHKHLKADGAFWVSVKEGDGEQFLFDKRDNVEKYRAYYREEELTHMLEEAGFSVIEIIRPEKKQAHTHQWLCFLCTTSIATTAS